MNRRCYRLISCGNHCVSARVQSYLFRNNDWWSQSAIDSVVKTRYFRQLQGFNGRMQDSSTQGLVVGSTTRRRWNSPPSPRNRSNGTWLMMISATMVRSDRRILASFKARKIFTSPFSSVTLTFKNRIGNFGTSVQQKIGHQLIQLKITIICVKSQMPCMNTYKSNLV